MSAFNLTTEQIVDIVTAALKDELAKVKDELTEEQKKGMRDALVGIAEERLALALADTPEKQETHRKNLAHYESAIKSFLGIARLKAYDSAISLTGRILAGIAMAAGKSLMA